MWGRRGAVLFIHDPQVQSSCGPAGRGWAGRTAPGGRAHSGPLTPAVGGGAGLGVLSPSQNQRRVGCRRRAKQRPAPHPQPASPFHPFCPRAPGNPEEPGKPPLPLAPFRPNRKPEGKTHKDGMSAQPRAGRLLPAREGLQLYLPTDDDHPLPNCSPSALRKTQETSILWPLLPGLERHVNTCDFSFPIKVWK